MSQLWRPVIWPPRSPSPRISPSTTATATCVEEAEVSDPRAILLPISPELFSISNWARYLYIYGRAFWYICILIHAACGQGQAVVVDRSQTVVLTAKPLTVSLIFCPMLSCRVSGMSLICFFTWHASSPRTTYLTCLLMGYKEAPRPWMHTVHSCYMLATLLD